MFGAGQSCADDLWNGHRRAACFSCFQVAVSLGRFLFAAASSTEFSSGKFPDTYGGDVWPRALDQVWQRVREFHDRRSHVSDMLGQISCLDLRERLVVSPLDVGNRRAGDYERRHQHRDDNH